MSFSRQTAGASYEAEEAQAILAQLERILSGSPFAKADQLRRFLAFIVVETVEGRAADLKEHVIAVQVLRKEADFDPRTDPIVRVQARRLRAKLEQYYRTDGAGDALIIELPRGTYAPVIRSRAAQPSDRKRSTPALISRNTVAVAGLVDLSSTGELGAFCDGVRAEIVDRLAQLRGIRLVDWDAQGESDMSHAALIVGGSVRMQSARIRVSLHLRDGPTRTYAWAQSFDGSLDDAMATQEKAAAALTEFVTSELRAAGGSWALRPAENLAAHNLCLQGRYHLNQRTEEGLKLAVDFFERAIREDERNALAHSGLADAYSLLGHYDVFGPAEVWTKAARLSASAVLLDDSCAEAHTSLAHVRATQDWDWDGAEREFRRALDLDPRYPTAHHWYSASCLAPTGRLDRALDEVLTAQELDPVSAIVARDVAVIHYYRRDFDAALEQCDHTIELNPHFAPAYMTLGLIQEQRGDLEESAAAWQRALQLAPSAPRILAAVARNLARAGNRDAAADVLALLTRLKSERYVSPFDIAMAHFALGDDAQGYQRLAEAFADRSFEIISANVDPRFDPLRGDARFRNLVAQLGMTGSAA